MSKKFLNLGLMSVYDLIQQSRQLSYTTRRDYRYGLVKLVHDLHAGGYPITHIRDLKPKHVHYLIQQWQQQELNTATIKNRLAQIRFVGQTFNKPNLIPKLNEDLNIGKRSYISQENKAIYEIDIQKFNNPLVRYSVQLQQHFGLRREESIKFVVGYADKGHYIELKDSWTKGGISRIIPVTTPEQRTLLDELKAKLGKDKALIAEDKTYAYQRNAYDQDVKQAGYRNLHGLRHAYAQRRYFELTQERNHGQGWQAPFNGGPHRKDLTPAEQKIDAEVREIISRLLGHSRSEIVRLYCGQ